MYGILLLSLLAADQPEASNVVAPPQLRPYHAINKDIRNWLRREATAKAKTDRAAAVFELTELYQELRKDPRLKDSDTLTEYKNKLWGRLTRVKKDIQREMAQAARKRPPKDATPSPQATGTDETASSVGDSLMLVGYSTGGPAQLLNEIRESRGGGAIPDFGPDLVALIERTIAPDFWDVHGGPGTIVYYAPLRVLVVRATGDVHADVGGVLGGLRAAGR